MIHAGAALAMGKAHDEIALLLATVQPTLRQRRLALVLGLTLLVIFGAAAPFANINLPQLNSIVSAHLALCFISDLITSVLLFHQFSIMRSRAMQVLACGYLFTALIVIPVALTFPGLFSSTGLLGAGMQTAGWLYFAWHFGFPAAVFGYTFLKDSGRTVTDFQVKSSIGWSVASVLVFVCGLTWLFTSWNDFMPRLWLDYKTLSPLVPYLGMSLVSLTAVAFIFLLIRQ